MSNLEHIPSKRRSPRATPSPLDHARPSPTVPRVTPDAPAPPAPMSDAERTKLLAAHPWRLTQKQLTAIAFKRIRARSLKDAEDIAQAAIVDAYESPENGGWDPAKGPLMGFLVGRVVGAAQNERRRKRNVCEVWIDEEIEEGEDEGISRHEKYLAADAPPSDEALHRLRFSHTVVERALARLAGDALATALAPHLKEGVSSIDDLARLTGRRRARSGRPSAASATTSMKSRRSSRPPPQLRAPARSRRERGDAMNRKPSGLALLKALRDTEADDDVAEVMAMSEAELDAYLRDNGGDPDAIGAAGEALAKELHAKRERHAPTHTRDRRLPRPRRRAVAPARAELSRAQLLARLDAARRDPRFQAPVAALFRDKSPEASTDLELWALLDRIELLAKLEDE